jgi:hypothetical protein
MAKTVYIIICFHLILAITACKDDTESNISSKDGKTYLKIDNNTEYAVNVYIDIPPLYDIADENKWRIDKNSSAQRELQPTTRTTLYFEYLIPIGSSTIPYYPFNVDFVKLINLEKGNVNTISVPSLGDLQLDFLFPDSIFILIKNNSEDIIWLQRGIVTVNPYESDTRDILPRKDAFFILDGNFFTLDNFTIGNTARCNFPTTTLEKGYVYEFIILDGEIPPKIIPDTIWKIKPEPTSTWKKEITKCNTSNFSNEELNIHLISITRRLGITNWRSNYPLNKILYYNNQLINCEMNFGIIPVIIQNTGIVTPYEIPSFSVNNTEWETSIVPSRNLYAGNEQLAYNTVFNDIIKLGGNYVVLTTYTKGLRTGLWLFFLNKQGQTINSWNIEPDNNLEGIIGTKLVKIDENNFLVLGNMLEYRNFDDEHFTGSSLFIDKYQFGNNTKIWSMKYKRESNFANLAICGLALDDSYIICGTASDNNSTKTTILKVNKTDGNIIDVISIGTANESIRPFSVSSDKEGCIYITGIATEGATSRAYILKLDPSYSQIWLKKYGNMYDNFLFDLNITDNLLTAVGSGNDGSAFDPAFYGWQSGKAWILKIDISTGIIIKEVFDDLTSAYNSIVRLDDGGFVLSAIESIDNNKPYWFNTFAVKANEHLER